MSEATDEQPIEQVLGLEAKPGASRRRLLFAVAVALVVLLCAVMVLSRGGPEGPDYETVELQRGSLEITVTAVGNVEPLTRVSVGSEQSGMLKSVFVEPNDEVIAGQVLAELDTEMLAARLSEADAQVAAAQANVELARVNEEAAHTEYDRAKGLYEQGAISTSERDQAVVSHRTTRAQLNAALAQLQAARAGHRVASINLDKATIRSPIDGVVLTRDAEPGQSVVSSLQAQTLFVVAQDLQRMKVEVEIDEAHIGRVGRQQPARFSVPAFGDRVFEAKVVSVDLAPNEATDVVTYDATLAVDNADQSLLPGMTATATITAEKHHDVLLVPNRALRWSPEDIKLEAPPEGMGRVWTLTDGVPAALQVIPGATDGRQTIVQGADLDVGLQLITGIASTEREG